MADQMPIADLMPAASIAGMAGVALIAEEVAQLAATASNMGGGSYKFQPSELQSVLKQWTDLQNTIAQAKIGVATSTPQGPGGNTASGLAPGNESASDTVAVAAAHSTTAYQTYLNSMQTYVDGYVEKLTTALHNYMQTEHGQAGSLSATQGHLA